MGSKGGRCEEVQKSECYNYDLPLRFLCFSVPGLPCFTSISFVLKKRTPSVLFYRTYQFFSDTKAVWNTERNCSHGSRPYSVDFDAQSVEAIARAATRLSIVRTRRRAHTWIPQRLAYKQIRRLANGAPARHPLHRLERRQGGDEERKRSWTRYPSFSARLEEDEGEKRKEEGQRHTPAAKKEDYMRLMLCAATSLRTGVISALESQKQNSAPR